MPVSLGIQPVATTAMSKLKKTGFQLKAYTTFSYNYIFQLCHQTHHTRSHPYLFEYAKILIYIGKIKLKTTNKQTTNRLRQTIIRPKQYYACIFVRVQTVNRIYADIRVAEII